MEKPLWQPLMAKAERRRRVLRTFKDVKWRSRIFEYSGNIEEHVLHESFCRLDFLRHQIDSVMSQLPVATYR